MIGFGFATSAPIVAAFLIQASVYLAPCFPELRAELIRRYSRVQIGAGLAVASLLPYLVYSAPLGLFSPATLAKLVCLCSAVAFVYVLFPVPRREKFGWQDAIVIALTVTPMISGIGFLREAYPGIGDPVDRLDVLGKLMIIALGASAILLVRGIEGTGLTLRVRAEDVSVGLKYFAMYLPVGLMVSLAIGHIEWTARELDGERALGLLGVGLGIFLVTALAEEFCFRGVVQNLLTRTLGSGYAALAIASVFYGAVHLSFGYFPNWKHVVASTILGWFCGLAYARSGSVVPGMITHTLVVVVWTFLFRP